MLSFGFPFNFQEKQMTSSLGEALKGALAKQWASDDEAHGKMEQAQKTGKRLFAPTNNITRATFDLINRHPAARVEILGRLKADGYNGNSVSSLITQMLRQGMVVLGSDGKLRTTVPKYVPLKPWKYRAVAQTKPKIVLRKKEAREEPQRPVSTPSPVWSVDDVLTQLNIRQARAVYDELHKIFGDAK